MSELYPTISIDSPTSLFLAGRQAGRIRDRLIVGCTDSLVCSQSSQQAFWWLSDLTIQTTLTLS